MENRRPIAYFVLFLLFLVGLFAFSWFSNQSRIILNNKSGTGEYIYQLSKQGSKNVDSFKSSESQVERRLPSGSYQMVVYHNNTSFVAVVSLKGFFRKTVVDITTSPEHSRVFIGKSPAFCMDSINNQLFSFDCGDKYTSLKYHVPSTTTRRPQRSTPTYEGLFTNVEGTFHTSQGNFVLMKNNTIVSGIAGHSVYKINSAADSLTLAKSQGTGLSDLDNNTLYKVRAYKDGFVVYAPDFSHIYYYTDRASRPTDLAIGGAKTKGLVANQGNFDVSNDTVLTTYSSGDLSGSNLKSQQSGAKTEVVYGKPGSVKYFSINGYLSGAQLCGSQKMCLLDTKNVLSVYDISGKSPKKLYQIYNIDYIDDTPAGFLALNKGQQALFNVDIDKAVGYIEYSLGDYQFNRLQETNGGFILSLTDNKKQEMALFIDGQKVDTDSIDKKILSVQNDPSLTATTYGNVIFFNPYIGAVKYNPATRSFDTDPGAKAAAVVAINKAVDNAGIDRKTYTIASTVR